MNTWWNMKNLHVATVQTNLYWEDPQANRNNIQRMLEQVESAVDIIVLPEMFTTGFSMRPETHAELMAENMPTLVWMREMADGKNSCVTGTISVKDGDQFYNRIFWVYPDGSYEYAEKRHLFTLGSEHEHYSAGKSRLIAEYKGWKINPMCCYDLRFPVWCRNTMNEDYPDFDVQIFMANWPEVRVKHWNILLAARAVENQAYVVGTNIVGADGNGVPHSGHSQVIGPAGNQICLHEDDYAGIKLTTLDAATLARVRKSLAFLKDQDAFEIEV